MRPSSGANQLLALLREIRYIDLIVSDSNSSKSYFSPKCTTSRPRRLTNHSAKDLPSHGLLEQLKSLADILYSSNHIREAQTLSDIHALCILSPDFAGLGYDATAILSAHEESEVLFLASAWLESLNSDDRSRSPAQPLLLRPAGRRSMTVSEKIFAAHDIDGRGEVSPGDVIRVDVDWIMASELSWFVWARPSGSSK